MDLRCRRTNCKYNKNLTCISPKVDISHEKVCLDYEKGEDNMKDFSSLIFFT